jgi:hypothetical protein
MMNAPAVGKRWRTISTPSSVTGPSPALRLTAINTGTPSQFAPWPASILPNGWQSPAMRVEAVRHALFESAADVHFLSNGCSQAIHRSQKSES